MVLWSARQRRRDRVVALCDFHLAISCARVGASIEPELDKNAGGC